MWGNSGPWLLWAAESKDGDVVRLGVFGGVVSDCLEQVLIDCFCLREVGLVQCFLEALIPEHVALGVKGFIDAVGIERDGVSRVESDGLVLGGEAGEDTGDHAGFIGEEGGGVFVDEYGGGVAGAGVGEFVG
ncbi:MAG: hypothetical protein RI897_4109 [Verrucomicrobiota bacterium]